MRTLYFTCTKVYTCTRVRVLSVYVYVYTYLQYCLLQVLPLYLTCTRVCVLVRAHVPAEILIYRYIFGTPGAYPVLHMYLRTRVLMLSLCNL